MNTGRIIICVVSLLGTLCLYGQIDLDSLNQLAQSSSADSIKVAAYNAAANELAFIKPDSGAEVARIAIVKSKKSGLVFHTAKGFQNLGLSFHVRGMLDSARKYYLISLPLLIQVKDSLGIAGLYNNIGVTYNQQGDFPRSLEYYQQSLDIKLALGQIAASAKTLNNIGVIYFDQKDFDRAMTYYQRALELDETMENSEGLSRTLGNIGLTYLEKGNDSLALKYYLQSYQLIRSVGNCRTTYSINGVGQAFSKLKMYDSAKYYLKKALDKARDCNEAVIQTSALLELGNIGMEEKRMKVAEALLLESELIARNNGLKTHLKDASQKLYEFYKKTGQAAKALSKLETAFALQDSLFNDDLTAQLTTMELEYSFQQERDSLNFARKSEIMEYDSKIERQNFIQVITGLILLLAVIFIFIIYRYYRLKNNANLKLTEKNLQISEALEEREVLLQEVHHRVKNNLQVVSSLLNIQSKFLDDDKAKKAILEGRDRVLSMALVHQRLYENKNLSRIDIREYLEQLADALLDSYQVAQEDVKLQKDIDQLDLDLDTSIHLGLIVNELISNSLKHAFKGLDDGKISLSLKASSLGYYLSISDNGTGVEDESTLLKSYGFRIVKSLVRGLKADLNVNTQNGTSILISFNRPTAQST